MKIKRIKDLKVNSYNFTVKWDINLDSGYGSISYPKHEIIIGIKNSPESEIFETVCHELMELCSIEMHVRFARADCAGDYIFVYDHRQHDTMMNMFAGLVSQFIK